MKKMIITYWFIFRPFKYLTYHIRKNQGLSKNYSFDFTYERDYQEIMAFLLMTEYDYVRGIHLIKV